MNCARGFSQTRFILEQNAPVFSNRKCTTDLKMTRILANQTLWKNSGVEKYVFGRGGHMATVTQCWRRRWKRCDSYVTAVVARADAEVKPSSSVASLGALPKHIHCKPGIEPLLHPVFLKYVQLYLSRLSECISNHIIAVAEIKPRCSVCCITANRF